MKARLKQNVIANGRFYERDSVIDDEIIGELKTNKAILTYDLEDRSEAMILRELNLNVLQTDQEGFSVSRPRMMATGQTVAAREIPTDWQEGRDYKFGWTLEERRELQEKSAAYLKQFQPEPVVPGRGRP